MCLLSEWQRGESAQVDKNSCQVASQAAAAVYSAHKYNNKQKWRNACKTFHFLAMDICQSGSSWQSTLAACPPLSDVGLYRDEVGVILCHSLPSQSLCISVTQCKPVIARDELRTATQTSHNRQHFRRRRKVSVRV